MSSLSSAENNPLLGTWKLIAAAAIDSNGMVEPEAYGPDPKGYITYTSEGRVMVIFSRSDRPLLSQAIGSPLSGEIESLPIEERAQAFSGFNAYAGTYTLNENKVTHHIEMASIPNRVGTDLVRTFTINGNRVRLQTPPATSAGVSKTFELVWERVELY